MQSYYRIPQIQQTRGQMLIYYNIQPFHQFQNQLKILVQSNFKQMLNKVVITLATAAIGALVGYHKRDSIMSFFKKQVRTIPREKILELVKQIRQKMYIDLIEVSSIVKQNASKYPPDMLRSHIMEEESEFMKNTKEKLQSVFVEFTQDQFQHNITNVYKNDYQIQYHVKKYQEQYQKSLLGVPPEIGQEVITFLTSEKLLKICLEVLENKLKVMNQSLKQRMTIRDVVVILRAEKQKQKKFRSQKLKEMGLIGKDDELAKIFEFGIAKMKKLDKQFESSYNSLIEEYGKKYNDLLDSFCAFPRPLPKNHLQ